MNNSSSAPCSCGGHDSHNPVRFPAWLKRPSAFSGKQSQVASLLESCGLNTVCAEAKCPNRGECFSKGTATFLILGSVCTRNCAFCGVESGTPLPPDPDEGERLAEAASRMGLKHVVITSVTRDDLSDGGAHAFATVVEAVRRRLPGATVEVLIPDFGGCEQALGTVLDSAPDVLNHNIETVPRLYSSVRPQAEYDRSLELLSRAASDGRAAVKSGMMVGLGEQLQEVEGVMADLRASGCTILTVGQYLRPSRSQVPVKEFVTPQQFSSYEQIALSLGFEHVFSGPYVRSSYRAEEQFRS
ncbi:MAG: lipoyl synthase [Chitinispirillaceae bacterium]